MCGIGGWFGTDKGWDSQEFLQALRQRGPDGSGVWSEGKATLIHTRLAILDLSSGGEQPMEYTAGDHGGGVFRIVFNGEIYNYKELRSDLEAQGESFNSDSDTEVLLRLLVREGESCLSKLAGMFAFAFWDEKAGVALFARDSMGIKPLYYRNEDGGGVVFSSFSRILTKPADETDPSAVRDFFLWGSVPEPATLSKSVRQLQAGHCLRWKDGKTEINQWYQPTEVVSSSESCIELTRNALEESVQRHLVSDVPVGIFLSGGIDSTAILALARQRLGPDADLRTFSIGFDDPEFDESSLARRTAEHFGTRHTEWRMTSSAGAAELEAFLNAVDQPSIDGFNTWCVSKLAQREGMKVVLSGLGGDEFFAGYGSFQRVPTFRKLYKAIGPFRGLLAAGLSCAADGSPWRRLAAYLKSSGSQLAAFHAQRGIFTEAEARVLASHFTGYDPGISDWNDPEGLPSDARDLVSFLEVSRYMRNQLLRDSDVFSMAHSLELRVPLVDARLNETLRRISPDVRLRQGKQLLLEAVPEIPEWVWNQPKRGFRFPFQQWMESQFEDLLVESQEISPVVLKEWYRIWAVAALTRSVGAEK